MYIYISMGCSRNEPRGNGAADLLEDKEAKWFLKF